MIDRFADWFAGVLLEKGVITEDELEVQVYGIQTILSNLLSYGVVLAVSWAFGVLPLSAVFLAVYTVLRKTVGGWHAKTPFSCALSIVTISRLLFFCCRTFPLSHALVYGRSGIHPLFSAGKTCRSSS